MSEVEKMYENAGVKECCTLPNLCRYKGICAKPVNCEHYDYPDFTAEKQLEIVKMILFSTWWMNLKRLQFSEKFDEGLAQMINDLWQDLTEQKRTAIAEILRG